MDINSAGGRQTGLSFEKLGAIAEYQTSDLFTPDEKAALRYTDEMCRLSIDVPDAVFDELRRHFNDAEIVELTATIALENFRARFNRALQVPADGFCPLPADHPALQAASHAS
ncbi:MAG: carboxymuconolactone decarboxylase family protein [Candidatus Binataceae bacterium]